MLGEGGGHSPVGGLPRTRPPGAQRGVWELRLPGRGASCKHRARAGETTFTSKKADPKVGQRLIPRRKATLASSGVLSRCCSQASRMLCGEGR